MTTPTAPTAQPPLIWIDLEMTGLDPQTCKIIEIATLITDGELNILADGPELVIHQPDDVLGAMNGWCTDHHGQSGLTEQVRRSTLSTTDAEAQTLAFVRAHCPAGESPLCGNSVHMDRVFLDHYMPTLAQFVHYRNVDVSSIKELAKRWYPDLAPMAKRETHRALDDIRESIEELRHYRKLIFREPNEQISP